MRPITDVRQITDVLALLRPMMDGPAPSDFSREWIHEHGWKVVPVEDTAHFAAEEIERIVHELRNAGYSECVAIATELVAPEPEVYRLRACQEDLQAFNATCGVLRYLLTGYDRGWAISCGEWFNLFAGPPSLVEGLLGSSIDVARSEFLSYAQVLASNKDQSAMLAAKRYSEDI